MMTFLIGLILGTCIGCVLFSMIFMAGADEGGER